MECQNVRWWSKDSLGFELSLFIYGSQATSICLGHPPSRVQPQLGIQYQIHLSLRIVAHKSLKKSYVNFSKMEALKKVEKMRASWAQPLLPSISELQRESLRPRLVNKSAMWVSKTTFLPPLEDGVVRALFKGIKVLCDGEGSGWGTFKVALLEPVEAEWVGQ